MPKHEMKCYIIAGSIGAGKTTFAENFLFVDVIIRRYHRGWENFQKYYKNLVDAWVIFDNSKEIPEVLEEKNE